MSEQDLKKWQGRAKIPDAFFEGPEDIRNAFILSKGIDWTASYIDPAGWIAPTRTLVSYTGQGFDEIQRTGSGLCAKLGITVREGGERLKIRQAQEDYEARTSPPHRSFAHRDAAE
jgi:hypothetical protein